MKSSITEEKGLQRKLEFVVPVQEVEKCFSENYQKIQKKAKMPGFRQGKIPLKTLKQNYRDQAYKAVMDDLFRSFYPKALKERGVYPAGPPTLIDLNLQEGKDCRFLLELEIHPKVHVKQYIGLGLKEKKVSVTEEDVTEALEKLRQSCAKLEDSAELGPLKKGDFCNLKVEGFLANQRKIRYPSLLLQAGDDTVAPGFDQHLMSLRLDESRKFSFQFPKNYPDHEIAGQSLFMQVQLKGFKIKHVPELNDDLAKRFKLETLKELKGRIKKDLTANLEQKAKEEMENNILQQLAEKNPVELPGSLVKEQKQKLQDNARERLREYKMPKAEQEVFIKEKDPVFEKEARESLHISYLMEQLIKELKIKTTDEDIQKSLRESFPTKNPEDMKQDLKKGGYWDNFVFNLTRKKVIAYLIENAHITK